MENATELSGVCSDLIERALVQMSRTNRVKADQKLVKQKKEKKTNKKNKHKAKSRR